MNVTRNVMNDLLPLYFSGEASGDTRTLVEEYFRENPEFERMARGSARSLDALRGVTAVAPEAEKEKRDLKKVHKAMWRRKLIFGMALFFTLAPLAFVYSKGHFVWLMLRNDPWTAAFYWGFAVMLWVVYFARARHRTFVLAVASFVTVFCLLDILHYVFGGGPRLSAKEHVALVWEMTAFGGVAALCWIQFFARIRRHVAALLFSIFLTLMPVPFFLYHSFGGGPSIGTAAPGIIWCVAAVMWAQYFRLRRKAKAGEDLECQL